MNIKISIKKFDQLTTVDLYHILRSRQHVFVVEQNCVYQDIDGLDFDSLHLVAHENAQLVGYCRIIPPNLDDEDLALASPSDGLVSHPMYKTATRIGRVLVLPQFRNQGVARQVMTQALKHCQSEYKKQTIVISAQSYLLDFYKSLGFEVISEPYLEDGIEHIDMILQSPKRKLALPAVKNVNTKTVVMNFVLFIIAAGIIGLLYLLI